MKKILIVLFFLICWTLLTLIFHEGRSDYSFERVNLQPCNKTTNPAITPSDIQTRIEILAADSMEGRNTPSKGLDRSVRYAASELACYGLLPGASDTSYIQYVPFHGDSAPNI